MPPKAKPLAERFWRNVDVTPGLGPRGDCHEYVGLRHERGYGLISLGGRQSPKKLAHRVAWFLRTGQWPMKHVLHSCDNPPCVRFEHLFEGTQADNMHDMARKGRARGRGLPGERNGNARLTRDQVRAIRRDPRPTAVIAAEFRVGRSTVSGIKLRRSWRHVKDVSPPPEAGTLPPPQQ